MKKTLVIAAVAALFASTATLADTVSVTSQTAFSEPQGTITSSGSFAFGGTKTITFTVAGKTCNLNGSARGSVPMGCNYAITVAPNGSITGQLTAGNNVCTQTAQVASSCK
ncbi:MAG: hypothetical protein GY862_11985 [Gammaproteobacteria bacterium]|nr:hypothetical protein [Gammaproteobacteria bacterium]